MRRTYEAIFERGSLKWIGDPPDINDGDRVVVIADTPACSLVRPQELEEAWEAARGVLRSGKTIDQVDQELAALRDEDWRRDWGATE